MWHDPPFLHGVAYLSSLDLSKRESKLKRTPTVVDEAETFLFHLVFVKTYKDQGD